VLYGGNATGKSSITDAWEWLVSGKSITSPRRRQESAYPHVDAKPGTTYVEIEFARQDLRYRAGDLRQQEDHDAKIYRTSDCSSGNSWRTPVISTRPISPGSCCAESPSGYDALAALMDFVPQMEYQKGLRRIESALVSDLDGQRAIHKGLKDKARPSFYQRAGRHLLPLQLWRSAGIQRKSVRGDNGADQGSCGEAEKSCDRRSEMPKKLTAIKDLKSRVHGSNPPQLVAEKSKALTRRMWKSQSRHSENRDKMRRIPMLRRWEHSWKPLPRLGIARSVNPPVRPRPSNSISQPTRHLTAPQGVQDKVSIAKEAVRSALSQTFYQIGVVPEGYTKASAS